MNDVLSNEIGLHLNLEKQKTIVYKMMKKKKYTRKKKQIWKFYYIYVHV